MRTEKFTCVPARAWVLPSRPDGKRWWSIVTKLRGWRSACAAFLFCVPAAIVSPAQTFTTLISFNGTDGSQPVAGLAQGRDGNLYGTTATGGANNGYGTVFKITPKGTLTTLYSFCAQTNCTDGGVPEGGLVLGTDGNFYGTTASGGAYYIDGGTVFKITPSGTMATLHSFCRTPSCSDGASPYAGLVQATDGNFYGTTSRGGGSYGTIFRITSAGKLTKLYSFIGLSGGAYPNGLIQATDGNFYGVTYQGGVTCFVPVEGCGTVFKITPSGKLTMLHAFRGDDGALPVGALVQGSDGNFYGETLAGGAGKNCQGRCGTVFKITPKGVLTTLHSFDSTDGAVPDAGLIQATDGNFYGTTSQGGDPNLCTQGGGGCGTLFKITSTGTLTTLHAFDCADSAYPEAALVQATSGNFYGTTYGFTCGPGTVFRLSVRLGPFVETLPKSGKVGTKVIILGTNLTGTSSVSFHGVETEFTEVSKSEIKTTVPVGATTGKIKVQTPRGTLSSNAPFRVTN
jgi:uncharacterized repeat protein (TIGR03803 family)